MVKFEFAKVWIAKSLNFMLIPGIEIVMTPGFLN